MKFNGTIIGEASGSVASLTFSHNRGGQYIRKRSIPVNPGTTYQQDVRNAMSGLASRWNNTLTAAQRAAWDTYALNVPIPDSLGEPRNIGGLGQFQRSNVPVIQIGETVIDDAPTVFNLGEFTTPTFPAAVAATEALSIAFTDTDEWANEDGGFMIIYGSRPANPSINFFKGPYRFSGLIIGDSSTPPTTPASITNAFPFGVGNRVFVQGRVLRADGRLSSPFRLAQLGS